MANNEENAKVNDGFCCAHINVRRFQVGTDCKIFEEQWRCADCGTPFHHLPNFFPGKIQIMEPVRTLRDEFAMAAMQGLFSASYDEFWVDITPDIKTTKHAYAWADAMIEARKV